ncbi:hypothetical protein [Pseudofrankia sp. BMG5.37]|uniref:hypothetical protein n=1 Tax=Pseudofrankia sp. BMG5.37 TaxID=3050035 RepID=UPI00289490FD|nr:hypothetical protein [Pseudofrankia sp. BMG5.37]MDT3441305.1 hypothetical protein [Pseudofrankia sp. BMG5.37]
MDSPLYGVAWPRLWTSLVDAADVVTLDRAQTLARVTAVPARLAAFIAAVNDAGPAPVAEALVGAGLTEAEAADVAGWLASVGWATERGLFHAAGLPVDVSAPPVPAEPWPGLPTDPAACQRVLDVVTRA